jgi:hypothetical protein
MCVHLNFPSSFTSEAAVKDPSVTKGYSHRACFTFFLERFGAAGTFSRESDGQKAIPSMIEEGATDQQIKSHAYSARKAG